MFIYDSASDEEDTDYKEKLKKKEIAHEESTATIKEGYQVKEKEKEREKQLRKNINDLYAARGRREKPKYMMKNI